VGRGKAHGWGCKYPNSGDPGPAWGIFWHQRGNFGLKAWGEHRVRLKVAHIRLTARNLDAVTHISAGP